MIVTNYQQLLLLVGTPEYDQIVEISIDHQGAGSLPDPLPVGLQELICENNRLTALPALPEGLQQLYCTGNQLTALPALPIRLQQLYCTCNQLTVLPALPVGLQVLSCTHNQLTALPALPLGLQQLYCTCNQLTAIPALPVGLQKLYCNGNPLPFFELKQWKAITRVWYLLQLPRIRTIQRRWRQHRQFQTIKWELVERIYSPDNPCGPMRSVGPWA